jgi:hypothetical protein
LAQKAALWKNQPGEGSSDGGCKAVAVALKLPAIRVNSRLSKGYIVVYNTLTIPRDHSIRYFGGL